jgi:hypothetical protein
MQRLVHCSRKLRILTRKQNGCDDKKNKRVINMSNQSNNKITTGTVLAAIQDQIALCCETILSVVGFATGVLQGDLSLHGQSWIL